MKKVDLGHSPDIHIKLSRTNIESLLYMLDNRDKQVPALTKQMPDGTVLVVEVQEDDEHYGNSARGLMTWEVEGNA